MNVDFTKLAGVLAILFGAALLWVPPAALAHDAALGLGVTFATGGFAALGVSIGAGLQARANAQRAIDAHVQRTHTAADRHVPR